MVAKQQYNVRTCLQTAKKYLTATSNSHEVRLNNERMRKVISIIQTTKDTQRRTSHVCGLKSA